MLERGDVGGAKISQNQFGPEAPYDEKAVILYLDSSIYDG
jgi:hypothetical protein